MNAGPFPQYELRDGPGATVRWELSPGRDSIRNGRRLLSPRILSSGILSAYARNLGWNLVVLQDE
jgi:hypothetical protein